MKSWTVTILDLNAANLCCDYLPPEVRLGCDFRAPLATGTASPPPRLPLLWTPPASQTRMSEVTGWQANYFVAPGLEQGVSASSWLPRIPGFWGFWTTCFLRLPPSKVPRRKFGGIMWKPYRWHFLILASLWNTVCEVRINVCPGHFWFPPCCPSVIINRIPICSQRRLIRWKTILSSEAKRRQIQCCARPIGFLIC